MRLIDADALANGIVSVYGEDGLTEDASLIYGLLLNAPTIDIAEVCGECKPYEPCIYCKHEFENEFETYGVKMDKE